MKARRGGMIAVLLGVTALFLLALPWLAGSRQKTPQMEQTHQAEERLSPAQEFENAELEAEAGNADAQFNLALMYDLGTEVEADPSKAALWYRQAAEQGHRYAQRNLAYLYDAGRGVEQDDVQAAHWNRKAAEAGDSGAQNNLGTMYYLGRGVDRDYDTAAYWFHMAAVQGDSGAQFNLGRLYEDGKEQPPDFARAYYWCHVAFRTLEHEANQRRAGVCRDRAGQNLSEPHRQRVRQAADAWEPGTEEPLDIADADDSNP